MADWEHILDEGQSLSVGSQGDPSLSTVSEAGNAWIAASDGTTAVPLKSSVQQRPGLSMGYRIGASRPGKQFAISNHGLGGQSLAQLSKGGSSGKYEQAIACGLATRSAKLGLGDTFAFGPMHLIQGEADQTFGTPRAAYLATLTQLHADHLTDLGIGSLPMVSSQTATWAHYGNAPSIGLAQLDAARTLPWFYLMGGQYQLSYAPDGLHMDNVGYYHLGELHARAHEAVVAGTGWAPFAPIATDLHPTYLDVTFHVPTGSLEFDTTILPAQPAMGFSLSGTDAAITSAAIVGADTVRLGLSEPVTEVGARVGYGVTANNGSVGLGNLCDGDTTLSVLDGTRLANWAVHFDDDLGVTHSGPTTGFELNDLYYTLPDKRLIKITFAA